MFTGIIEDLGTVKKIKKNQITVETKLDDIKIGDSICMNGVCLTVVNNSMFRNFNAVDSRLSLSPRFVIGEHSGMTISPVVSFPRKRESNLLLVTCYSLLTFDISEETLNRTNLGELKTGNNVNIERAIKFDGRFGGHFVTGHIDGVGKILSISKFENSKIFEFSNPENLSKYIVEKGSVAIDGASLTVVKKLKNAFTVAVIPHTMKNTTLGIKKVGQTVNFEIDILAKYVLQKTEKKEINIETLKKAGYL